jgi:chlorite dismutase
VQTVEQFGQRLVAEGMDAKGGEYQARVKAYGDRLVEMNKQRLTPDFPPYRSTCFYPMNKKRKVGENWFLLSKEERSRLMIEHARSGMAFAGKVTQLITVGLGLENWEWGVTLWAANPEYLKEIVYRMRFDEASARYAEFGPFIVGYVASAAEILDHCRIKS